MFSADIYFRYCMSRLLELKATHDGIELPSILSELATFIVHQEACEAGLYPASLGPQSLAEWGRA